MPQLVQCRDFGLTLLMITNFKVNVYNGLLSTHWTKLCIPCCSVMVADRLRCVGFQTADQIVVQVYLFSFQKWTTKVFQIQCVERNNTRQETNLIFFIIAIFDIFQIFNLYSFLYIYLFIYELSYSGFINCSSQ